MAKKIIEESLVLKINSKRLRDSNWNLKLTFDKAVDNDEIVTLANSETLRFIDDILGIKNRNDMITQKKKELLEIFNNENSTKADIRKKRNEINKLKYNPNYVLVIIDTISDFDRMNSVKKGCFKINGVTYRRLVGTSNGVKKRNITYVSENIYEELSKRLDNGRDMNVKHIPAKLESYKGLSCSASIPVSMPKGVLVVKDVISVFKEDVIKIDEDEGGKPTLAFVNGFDIEINGSDGMGIAIPKLATIWAKDMKEDYLPSGFCIRNSFCKGMVFTFDFHKFADKVAKSNIVIDVWGNEHNIYDIELVLTESMLKLWDSYSNIEHYLECCKQNKYTFSITKVTPKVLDKQRNLNYQFIQPLNLSDEDVFELIKPTVNEIKESLGYDYAKTLLFLRGVNMTGDNANRGDNDFVKALSIEKELIKDPYIRERILNVRKKAINNAKIGTIKVTGNYQILAGDPYALCQSMFGMEVTGLLKANNCYSKHWVDRNEKEVVIMRPPMSCENNIRKVNIYNDSETAEWYQYMGEVFILNIFDSICPALNGCDFDGDICLSTNNPVILKAHKKTPVIMCVQRRADKKIVKDKDLEKSNKDGFGDKIGSTTNKVTAMYDVREKFLQDSQEYKEISRRIELGQHFQQNCIDKSKGVKCDDMNKEFYSVSDILNSKDEDVIKKKEFYLSIVADKKPYFFMYIYPTLRKEYNDFKKKVDMNCALEGTTTEYKYNTDEDFRIHYDRRCPVTDYGCVMNRICHHVEYEFNDIKDKKYKGVFDKEILKSGVEYDNDVVKKCKTIYKNYANNVKEFHSKNNKYKMDKDEKIESLLFLKERFREEVMAVCKDEKIMCDVLIDICYTSNNLKSFVWNICADVIIDNLLVKNNNSYNYVEKDDSGDIEYCGDTFTLKRKFGGNFNEVNIK